MTESQIRSSIKRSRGAIPLLLMTMLLGAACDSGSPASSGPSATTVTGAAGAPAGTAATPGSRTNSNLDCQAIANAAFDFNSGQPPLVVFAGSGGSAVNRLDSPMYVDTAKMRADLKVLDVLPDPTDQAELAMFGSPHAAIAQYVKLLDLVDSDSKANAEGTPVGTPSGNVLGSDKQLLDFTTKLVKMTTAVSSAVDRACPGVSASVPGANAPAAPLKAGYTIGQTAPVGELRVTLDKVTTMSGEASNQPDPGNRFILAYFTVENTGKTAFAMNTLVATRFQDMAGKEYRVALLTSPLDPLTNNLDGDVQAGEKRSGATQYQLPRSAGDLVWLFEDAKPNQAVFSVKTGEVQAVGAQVTEPTANAMRAGAAATQTAFVGMALGAVATDAAAPPVPTDTPEPVQPTDTPEPAQPTDTPAP
jgi:hypothetical protein